MRRIRSKDTRPEISLRKKLYRLGFRYRLHQKSIPGTPDFFILKHKVAIFVNGCFWHGHGCAYSSVPKTNTDFWTGKFNRNSARDMVTLHKLKNEGVRAALVWECSLRREAEVLERLEAFIRSDEPFLEI